MYWPIGAPRVYAANRLDLGKLTEDDHEELEQDLVTLVPSLQPEDADETEKPTAQLGTKARSSKRSAYLKDTVLDYSQDDRVGGEIVAVKLSRSGHLFVSITAATLSVWQTKPTSVVATVVRSASSLKSYGDNVNVLLRPDSAIVVVQTHLGYLITYSLATDPHSRLYYPILADEVGNPARKSSAFSGPGEGHGIREVSIRFRMVIKVDAGISYALALDNELVVTTEKPPALQCVLWVPDESGTQATTTLLKTMPWISKKSHVIDMVDDRPMSISTWITNDGKCYTVQKRKSKEAPQTTTFKGHCFHDPETAEHHAAKSAINAKFSQIAVGCADSEVFVYTQKDYAGHIPLSHKLEPPASPATCGSITCILFSPDGYCIFVGYKHGWAMWSVYGKPGAHSFNLNRSACMGDDERWLLGVKDAFWIGGGSQLVILGLRDNRLWILDLARSAVTGCYSSANVARSLLQTNSGFMIYKGYDLPDLGTISIETGLWNHVQIPAEYLNRQWPIRSSVISADGRYVAVAGRRGLAHYNVTTERWKRFEDPYLEEDFVVKGGMCWHQHGLIVAVESSEGFQIRVYSREWKLDNHTMFTQNFNAPIVHLAPSGNDAILVYTMENHLYHFLIDVTGTLIRLEPVGQIALSGILKQPTRIRALSWILPDDQLEHGDPRQDVGHATVLFLIDGQLVVLQPSTRESGELKYDMRFIAQNVEYYSLMRDQLNFNLLGQQSSSAEDIGVSRFHQNDLHDSLWYFDGKDVRVWTDTQELLASTPPDLGRELPEPVVLNTDFYPLSILLSKGIIFGIEPEFIQRQNDSFVVLKFTTRTTLFIPQIFQHHLAQYNQPSALYLAHHYSHLTYFPHSLEVLLHTTLDAEVDSPPQPSQSLLPSVTALLAHFPQNLDILVQCTRKTEVRSWRTLFAHLPPPRKLFEESLSLGKLKTAGGYLLVLHNLDELEVGDDSVVELLGRAKEAEEWELCKELARFLMALDQSGERLRKALQVVDLDPDGHSEANGLKGVET